MSHPHRALRPAAVIDGMPGPVESIDVSADGGMIAWTTPEFVFLTCPNARNWQKGVKEPKPAVLKLSISASDRAALDDSLADPEGAGNVWTPVKFDATTAKDGHGLAEREIISYSGAVQVRWNVAQARAAWEALSEGEGGSTFHGVATTVAGPVCRHMTVKDDTDVVALEGEIVKSLRF